MKKLRAVLTVWLFLGGALTGHAQLSDAEKAVVLLGQHFRVQTNIVYKVANRYEAKLDVYRPSHPAGPRPALMMIHGGGWLFGSKEDSVLYLLPFLQMGFSVVNVEYRMGSVSLAPAAVEDCLCALHWIGRNAKEYEFDLGKLVITGGSAGGHLALTTAMIPPSAGFENECAYEDDQGWTGTFVDSRPKVAAVVNWFGITDVAGMLEGAPDARGYAIEWIGNAPNAFALATSVSPLAMIRPGIPPILTIHGDQDPWVPYSDGARLHEALQKAGLTNQLLTIRGGKHGDFTSAENDRIWSTIREFLKKSGLPTAP